MALPKKLTIGCFAALATSMLAILFAPMQISAYPIRGSIFGWLVIDDQLYFTKWFYDKNTDEDVAVMSNAEEFRSGHICWDVDKPERTCSDEIYYRGKQWDEKMPTVLDCKVIKAFLEENGRRCSANAIDLNIEKNGNGMPVKEGGGITLGDGDGGFLPLIVAGTCAFGISWNKHLDGAKLEGKKRITVTSTDIIDRIDGLYSKVMDAGHGPGPHRMEGKGSMICNDDLTVEWGIFNAMPVVGYDRWSDRSANAEARVHDNVTITMMEEFPDSAIFHSS